MQIIYVIDPSSQQSARVHIGCEAYRELFLDFILSRGYNAALTDEAKLPERSPAEQAAINELMVAFKNDLDSRVLN